MASQLEDQISISVKWGLQEYLPHRFIVKNTCHKYYIIIIIIIICNHQANLSLDHGWLRDYFASAKAVSENSSWQADCRNAPRFPIFPYVFALESVTSRLLQLCPLSSQSWAGFVTCFGPKDTETAILFQFFYYWYHNPALRWTRYLQDQRPSLSSPLLEKQAFCLLWGAGQSLTRVEWVLCTRKLKQAFHSISSVDLLVSCLWSIECHQFLSLLRILLSRSG